MKTICTWIVALCGRLPATGKYSFSYVEILYLSSNYRKLMHHQQLHHSYQAEMCIPVAARTGRCLLRSASDGDLMVPWTRTSTYGQRSFAVSGPSAWNDLPPTLRASSATLKQFQNKLKTVLFCSAYET